MPHKIKQTHTSKKTRVLPTLVALSIAQTFAMQASSAATIHVGGKLGKGCGLSSAILSANLDISHPGSKCVAGSGDDTIELHRDIILRNSWKEDSGRGKIDTFFGLPALTSNITINGNNHSIKRKDGAPSFGILTIGAHYGTKNKLIINDLTVSNADHEDSSGILIHTGDVEINNSTISNNSAVGITCNTGNLAISNSKITNNVGLEGGGIFTDNSCRLDIKDSIISKNTSLEGRGGGIYSFGGAEDIDISNTVFSENTAKDGGAISVIPPYSGDTTVTIDNSTFSNNTVTTGSGGAIKIIAEMFDYYGPGTVDLTVTDSVFYGNSAGNDGGAISLGGGINNISNSTFSNNIAKRGGAIHSRKTDYLFNILALNNVTISKNEAELGGGLFLEKESYSSNPMFVNNSLISGNKGSISNSEIAVEEAHSDSESSNNLFGSAETDNDQAFGSFTPSNTDITATIDGNNPQKLSEILLPLADNGGSTKTHALAKGSVAINNASVSDCYNAPVGNADQRGTQRVFDGYCSIGAYEIEHSGVKQHGITIEDSAHSEYKKKAIVTFKLSHPSTKWVKVDYETVPHSADPFSINYKIRKAAEEGDDYISKKGTVYFKPGQTERKRVFKIIDDADDEFTEAFDIKLSNPKGALIYDDSSTVTIYDNDKGGYIDSGYITVGPTKNGYIEAEEKKGYVDVVFTYSGKGSEYHPAFVDYTTYSTNRGEAIEYEDYTPASGTVWFAPGQKKKTRKIYITNDGVNEPTESFRIQLGNTINAKVYDDDIPVRILDSNRPTINIPELTEVNEEDGTAELVLTLSGPSEYEHTLYYYGIKSGSITPGVTQYADYYSDYLLGNSPAQLDWAPGETQKTIKIKLIDDSLPEYIEGINLKILSVGSTAKLNTEKAIVIIHDND